jgi:hypothetical protein
LVNGYPGWETSSPNSPIVVTYNVNQFPGTTQVYIEVSKPGVALAPPPEGVWPDPNHLFGFLQPVGSGQWEFVPSQILPTWGVYQIRIIPLTSGDIPTATFSSPGILELVP